ncbi:MAG: HlyD family secretion protein [Bacteroidia bacterium]
MSAPQIDHNHEELRIELRSEEVQEIMGYIPHWIIRWGITVFLLVVIAGLGLSWFVKYPDVLPAKVVLTTDPPPLRLAAPLTAKIEEIFVKEGESVEADHWLMVFESTADWQAVRSLESSLSRADTTNLLSLLPLPDRNLGSLQGQYSGFRKALEDWQFFKSSGRFRTNTRKGTSRQSAELKALNTNIEEQLALRRRELSLAENEFEINKRLNKEGTISRVELERSEVDVIQKRLMIKQLEAQIHNNEIQILSYQQRLGDFGQQNRQSELSLKITAQEAFQQVQASIRSWKQQFVLRAPEAGNIALFDLWSKSQQVEQGKAVLSLLPQAKRIIGKATLGQAGSGKLRIGQKANIKLDSYDYKQFGMLTAKVIHISPLPKKDQYLIDLELPQGLVTTYDKPLDFDAELYGNAEIITEELRLLERIFYEFKKLASSAE